jgi:hypothetical protein
VVQEEELGVAAGVVLEVGILGELGGCEGQSLAESYG